MSLNTKSEKEDIRTWFKSSFLPYWPKKTILDISSDSQFMSKLLPRCNGYILNPLTHPPAHQNKYGITSRMKQTTNHEWVMKNS